MPAGNRNKEMEMKFYFDENKKGVVFLVKASMPVNQEWLEVIQLKKFFSWIKTTEQQYPMTLQLDTWSSSTDTKVFVYEDNTLSITGYNPEEVKRLLETALVLTLNNKICERYEADIAPIKFTTTVMFYTYTVV